MAAVRDFGDTETGAADDAVELAKNHLVQPWPYAGSIGTEARSLVAMATGGVEEVALDGGALAGDRGRPSRVGFRVRARHQQGEQQDEHPQPGAPARAAGGRLRCGGHGRSLPAAATPFIPPAARSARSAHAGARDAVALRGGVRAVRVGRPGVLRAGLCGSFAVVGAAGRLWVVRPVVRRHGRCVAVPFGLVTGVGAVRARTLPDRGFQAQGRAVAVGVVLPAPGGAARWLGHGSCSAGPEGLATRAGRADDRRWCRGRQRPPRHDARHAPPSSGLRPSRGDPHAPHRPKDPARPVRGLPAGPPRARTGRRSFRSPLGRF